ncbi:hypothetical protein A1Q2_00054 [Trichosporon asahii var. asahii CBS 8904]|uniref:Uncharacterized protein n=1 Tax=Trichosporon asahii var. asahii (strain CBS 8904) TaxID=1220162 RepID=K1W1M4_TRIAC|nr:hypothetical protein A1Q2_00054 [Trichosporon asahii var. asahii CBS 8904]
MLPFASSRGPDSRPGHRPILTPADFTSRPIDAPEEDTTHDGPYNGHNGVESESESESGSNSQKQINSEADEDDRMGRWSPSPLCDEERRVPLRRLLRTEEQTRLGKMTPGSTIEEQGDQCCLSKRPRTETMAQEVEGAASQLRKRRRTRSNSETPRSPRAPGNTERSNADSIVADIVTEEEGRRIFDRQPIRTSHRSWC